ncbi:hypothetical protein [Planctomicrobium piriforme]|uniref:Uncharacterized protein n=1 Tax=Planctomicrobium piriforme TaxID=1576369 RepID=A0A1I3R971_9PLAN|nr:hypothetical protein [Planctomicrobium piriforme]SFJ42322.1 hypothetical protein SAMN05421753_12034 [Planctomicrobium piriforme]
MAETAAITQPMSPSYQSHTDMMAIVTASSAALTKAINVTAVNDAPVVAEFAGGVDFTGQTPVIIDSDAAVTDVDSTDLNGGKLTISLTANAHGADVLSIRNQRTTAGKIGVNGTDVTYGGVVIGTLVGGTNKVALVITFNATASPAAAQALLRNIQFSNTAATRSVDPRTVRILLTDGDGGTSVPVTKTVTVSQGNAAPVVSAFDGNVDYANAAGSAVLIDPDATITDTDSPNFDTGKLTVSLTVNGQSSDVFSIRNQGNSSGQIGVSGSSVTFGGVVIGTFSGGTSKVGLTVTLNANSSPAATQALLRAITFKSTLADPTTLARTVRAILTDGDGGTSTAVTKTIQIV